MTDDEFDAYWEARERTPYRGTMPDQVAMIAYVMRFPDGISRCRLHDRFVAEGHNKYAVEMRVSNLIINHCVVIDRDRMIIKVKD